jgi:hypothetical protein
MVRLKVLRFALPLVLTLLCIAPFAATAQTTSQPEALLRAPEAAKLLPDAVFFRGQSASTQARNSGGVRYADDMFVLVTLVDNSGYSTGIQQKYQAYFITEAPLTIGGHALAPGAYGVGIVGNHFGVMDIGAHDLFQADTVHDAQLHRPTPLQVVASETLGQYRIYFGRDYVTFERAK